MNYAYWWGIAAAVLIGVELLIGTFYLLMVALGLGAGALAAFLGLSLNMQILCATLTASVTTGLWHWKNYKNPRAAIYSENKDAIIDIGETVEVVNWDAQQTTKVRYRGAQWAARWVGPGDPQIGHCAIQGMKGSELQLGAPAA